MEKVEEGRGWERVAVDVERDEGGGPRDRRRRFVEEDGEVRKGGADWEVEVVWDVTRVRGIEGERGEGDES